MGTYFHITRAEGWSKSANSPITKNEWEMLIASDPELCLDPDNNHRFGALSANWVDPFSGKEQGWFSWSKDGEIFTRNPDRAQLAKMLQIAERFSAHVQDDHGFKYTRAEEMEVEVPKDWAAEERSEWWWMFGSAMCCLCLSIIGSWLLGWFSLFLWAMTGLLLFFCYLRVR